jgi:tetratricopeptide (TPR) repeat protein
LSTLEIDPGSVHNLRAAAMLLKDRKDFDMSGRIYERMLVLRPEESQTYRDLALSLADNEKFEESLEVYRKIKENAYPGVDFSGLKKVLNSEMKRLLLLHRNQLNTYGLESHYFTPVNYDVRVVVEWNDRDAEFVLQFVNPQKKFFLWSHNEMENPQRLAQERNLGFNTEEFLLIDAEPGKWQINIESTPQDSESSRALRYTVYRNYGTPEETRESRTLFLNDFEGKFLLGIIRI